MRTGERIKAASAIVSQLEVAGRYIVRVIVAGAGGGRKAAGTIIIIISQVTGLASWAETVAGDCHMRWQAGWTAATAERSR